MKQNSPCPERDSHDMFHVIDVERKKMAEKNGRKKPAFDFCTTLENVL